MKRVLLIIGGVVLALPLVGYAVLSLPVFGARPDANDRARFQDSPQFDGASGTFQNRVPQRRQQMLDDSDNVAMLREFFSTRPDGRPQVPLPDVTPDLAAFMAPNIEARVIWFGHSTFLLNLSGVLVLVDPVFSNSASPIPGLVTRFQAPVLELAELPPIDVVLISHDHYDHLDRNTVRALLLDDPTFIAPLGVGSHLQRFGVAAERIVERDWWQSHMVQGITFTAAPAQHFSGRTGFDTGRTLWASWIVATDTVNLYYSGDSGYDTHFAEIGERFGPFDMAFLENGQYDEQWRAVHLHPRETVQAAIELDAQRVMPVHWGMFELAFHTWYAPVEALARHAEEQGIELVTPLLGQIVPIDGSEATEPWWQGVQRLDRDASDESDLTR